MANSYLPKPLVSVKWLHNHLNDDNLLIFDASMNKVTSNANEVEVFQIPNTQYFDIKHAFSDTSVTFPNTVPSQEQFTKEAQRLGVNNDSIIVVYDDKGIYSSARAWWLFKTFGFKKVAILNGGLPEWIAKGFKTEAKNTQIAVREKGNYKAIYKADNVVLFEALKSISNDKMIN